MNATVESTPYQQLGGDTPLRQLVDRFYDVMLSEPSVETVRDMHSADTTQIRERSSTFSPDGWADLPASLRSTAIRGCECDIAFSR